MTDTKKDGRFKKGEESAYAKMKRRSTPEEWDQHLQDRAMKRTLKRAAEEVRNALKDEIVARLMNSGMSLLDKATASSDVFSHEKGWSAVWDRIGPGPVVNTDMQEEIPKDIDVFETNSMGDMIDALEKRGK